MLFDYALTLKAALDSAENGEAVAQYRLGVMYGLGLGVGQNYAESVKWYRKAAAAGDPRAQSNLGFMYGTGRGVPQDYIQAYAWYNVASASGEDTARKNRDAVADRMSPSQMEQAQKLSTKLFEEISQN
ncbi:MAG TPA: tetratricopeptide repeat protein [Gammaproteobacteria bacterium]